MTDQPANPETPWTLNTREADLPAIIRLIRALCDEGKHTGLYVEAPWLLRQLEEVWFWREETAAYLGFATAQLRVALDRDGADSDLTQQIARDLGSAISSLAAALHGDFHDDCPECNQPMVPGQPVINFDTGDMHANCAGASAEDIKAGRLTVPFDSLDLEGLEPAEIEQLRADPHVTIIPRTALYDDTVALRRQARRAEAAFKAFDLALVKAAADQAPNAEPAQ